MKISIALATYNGAKYLREQLDSFVTQRRLPDQLVVCDDRSTDQTVAVLEAFQKDAPFQVDIYCNQFRLGYSANFQKAVSLCGGDLIFLSDQDDVWFDTKLERVERLFQKNPTVQVIVNDHEIVDEKLTPTRSTLLGNLKRAGLSQSELIHGCCTSFRRSWCKIALPVPDDIPHDSWINHLATLFLVSYVHERPLQYYRRHGQNTSGFILNQPGGVSRWELIAMFGLRDAREGWQQDLSNLREIASRILDRSDALRGLGLNKRSTIVLRELDRKCIAIEQRIKIMSASRMRRVTRVLMFWCHGHYQYFCGWKSAVKDIVRP